MRPERPWIRARTGLLAFAAAIVLHGAPVTPSITVQQTVVCGSVIPGTAAGTLVLNNVSQPTGARSVTGGVQLGGSPTFLLGAITLSGAAGDPWSLTTLATTVPTNGTQTMSSLGTVTFSQSSGNFPAGSGTTTTATIYIGVTVGVKVLSGNPAGTYTGSLSLQVKDTATVGSSKGRTGTASVGVTLKVDPTPISLSKSSDLSFGSLALTSPAGGSVIIAPATGVRTVTGGLYPSASGGGAAATFTVTGAAGSTFLIMLPASLPLTGPGTAMTVDTFGSSLPSPAILGPGGTLNLQVGATLQVNPNQAPGTYTGTFSVTVAYN